MKKIMILTSLILITPVFAGNIIEYEDASLVNKSIEISMYQDPSGAQTYFNDDGSLRKILATGEAELVFGDRKDKRLALQIASMRAKAHIAKFLNESIKSSKTVDEIVKTISNKNGSNNISANRESIKTAVESLENKSESILQGVVTLQQSINTKKKFVTVKVGMKISTIKAAKNIANKMGMKDVKSSLPLSTNIQRHDQRNTIVRRSKMADNF